MRLRRNPFKMLTTLMAGLMIMNSTVPAVNASQHQVNTVQNRSTKATLGQHVNAKAAVTIDAKSGKVLYGQNADQKLPIASVIKILTLAVIEQDVKNSQLSWNQQVKITKPVAKIANDWHFSNVELDAGHRYRLRDLANSMMVVSADGSAAALALADAGSTAKFNKKMQSVARKAGVRDAKIYNMIGLDNGSLGKLKLRGVRNSAENQLSALDVAKIARYLIREYPDSLNIMKGNHVNFKANDHQQYDMVNINMMLSGNSLAPKGWDVDGLKTGTTDKAGNCFAGTEKDGHHRYITVVLNVPGDYNAQFMETISMLEKVTGKKITTEQDVANQQKNQQAANGQPVQQ